MLASVIDVEGVIENTNGVEQLDQRIRTVMANMVVILYK